jgi:hypothetical protein
MYTMILRHVYNVLANFCALPIYYLKTNPRPNANVVKNTL